MDLPPQVCQCSGQFGVVLIGVERERWGPHPVHGHLPVGPLHDPAVPLHEHGQVATASARALRLAQHHTSPLAGRPEGTATVGGQRLLRKRPAASSPTAPATTSSPSIRNRNWAAQRVPAGTALTSSRWNTIRAPYVRTAVTGPVRPGADVWPTVLVEVAGPAVAARSYSAGVSVSGTRSGSASHRARSRPGRGRRSRMTAVVQASRHRSDGGPPAHARPGRRRRRRTSCASLRHHGQRSDALSSEPWLPKRMVEDETRQYGCRRAGSRPQAAGGPDCAGRVTALHCTRVLTDARTSAHEAASGAGSQGPPAGRV